VLGCTREGQSKRSQALEKKKKSGRPGLKPLRIKTLESACDQGNLKNFEATAERRVSQEAGQVEKKRWASSTLEEKGWRVREARESLTLHSAWTEALGGKGTGTEPRKVFSEKRGEEIGHY